MHTPTHLLSSHRHASCCIECVQRPLIQMRLIQAADTSDNPLETDLQEMATIDAANEVKSSTRWTVTQGSQSITGDVPFVRRHSECASGDL
mmetsp:Transcript_12315/g.30662  ORF Transcript_12315/g.30662 Transcript_12315/m.30662 type:complete len:91 (+) Transcript_12315:146-418(+)